METVQRYRVANTGTEPLVLYLEPWGGEYSLAPGEHAELLVQGPLTHPLRWEYGDGTLVISSLAEAQAMLSLWRDGVEIPAR